MTIDIRARVESNLGPVISASINDDYIQENGLIKTSGSCIVKGLISPAIGTLVTFSYTKSGITRQIPRALRVLSSFADPFRKTTSVQLGCKLTYLSDLKEPIDWTAFDDPNNGGFTEEDTKIVIVPIRAQAIAEKCLTELGITVAAGFSLTNIFSIETFDLSSGYVQVLSDLLVSEGYCGWLNQNEILQIINLNTTGGSGPLIQESDIIDVGEIGVGQIPGDAVIVSYSSLKLKIPEDEEITEEDTEDLFEGWEYEYSSSSGPGSVVTYKDRYEEREATEGDPAPLRFAYFGNYTFSETSTEYALINVLKSDLEVQYSAFGPSIRMPNGLYRSAGPEDYEKRSVVTSRTTREGRPYSEVAGGWVTDALSVGQGVSNYSVITRSVETYSYDAQGNEIFRELTKTGDAVQVMGAAGVPYVYEIYQVKITPQQNGTELVEKIFDRYDLVNPPGGDAILERVTTETSYLGDATKTVTKRWGSWAESVSGQQTIAASQEFLDTAAEAESLIGQTINLTLLDVTTDTSIKRPTIQTRPSDQEILKGFLTEYSTESSSEIELVTGNESAQLRIEFSLPYAPDDSFFIVSSGPPAIYGSTASDAPQKAKNFGIIQNKLLLGNRSGMNVQTVPEKLPLNPFSEFFISANGVISLYRTNATSWTIDNNGIIVSTDALYWGIAGQI